MLRSDPHDRSESTGFRTLLPVREPPIAVAHRAKFGIIDVLGWNAGSLQQPSIRKTEIEMPSARPYV